MKTIMAKSSSCRFCNIPIYIEVEEVAMPVLAPLTEVGAAWDNWVKKSGRNMALLQKAYCPICGRKLDSEVQDGKTD